MRTIEFSPRFPSLKAVWMKGPFVEIRSHSEPKCPMTTFDSVGSPRMHMSATPPCETRCREPAAYPRYSAPCASPYCVFSISPETAAIITSPRSRTPASASARSAST